MGIFNTLFGRDRSNYLNRATTWEEIGQYRAVYTSFGDDIFASDLVRDCIRALSDHTSKATAHCKDKRIEDLITYRPNLYMNGKDFLEKCRNLFEVKNNLFIYINRDDTGKAIGLYPVPYAYLSALDVDGELYIQFSFPNRSITPLVASWRDLAAFRKDFLKSDITGEANTAIIEPLEIVHTTNEGVANAIKATGNLRGIVKSTKANLKQSDVKQMKDDFVKDYMGLDEGGIAALDASMEFIPIKMEPVNANAAQMREFREQVYRYYGVNEAIVTSDYTEAQMEAFYEARIEPFLVALSLELTSKIFTEKQRAFGNKIEFSADRIQYASLQSKLGLVAMVDRGALTPNEWRRYLNLAPIEGGDKPIRRLDTEIVDDEPLEGDTDDQG